MNPVELQLPQNAKVLFNSLYRTCDPQYLTQDLLAIALPLDKVLDVSWFPDFDLNGTYIVTVQKKSWDVPPEYQFESRDLDVIKKCVETLASSYAQNLDLVPTETLDQAPSKTL